VEPSSRADAVQDQVWAVDRNEIILLTTPLEDFQQRFTYATPEFGLLIATSLASISLLLLIVGVFSVMAYTVSLQTQEIGIRMPRPGREEHRQLPYSSRFESCVRHERFLQPSSFTARPAI
jgi:hypothetical protein